MHVRFYLAAFLLLLAIGVTAQQSEHHHDQSPPQQQSDQDMQNMPGIDHSQMDHDSMHGMHHHDSSLEFGSGSVTAWAPQSSPENMWMTSWRDWQLMARTNIIV